MYDLCTTHADGSMILSMNCSRKFQAVLAVFAVLLVMPAFGSRPAHAMSLDDLQNHRLTIRQRYSEQLTDPQKKSRKSLAQFGYNLSYLKVNFYPITEFINPMDYGTQSYGKPGKHENNGSVYSCNGGFLDFSHMRAAVDWSVFMTFTLLSGDGNITLPPSSAELQIRAHDYQSLSIEEIADLGEKIAFERLVWHEIASWHYHAPNHIDEQQSTFSIEDSYSNFLGATIGKRVALRLLDPSEVRPYAEVATEEILKTVQALHPMTDVKKSKMAYDLVDRFRQSRRPSHERNRDIWWDSKIIFRDQRYLFKRVLPLSYEITPWLVPQADKLGCVGSEPQILQVPQRTLSGKSFYDFYSFKITPEKDLFYANRSGKQLHAPIAPFTSDQMFSVINHLKKQMEAIFGPGFDARGGDPVPTYKHVKWRMFYNLKD